jgi:tetratricopeptide (TPR) repeat protein
VTPKDDDERRRFAIVVGEARWLLGDPAKAKEALSDPTLASDALAQDLLARACYATKDFAGAADAWGRAGNERGRAAAWSAGKDPRAIASYAALALAHLDDTALCDEAIRGAAYVDGGAGLDAALVAAEVPAERRPAIDRLRGRIFERRGKYAEAVARYRAIVAVRPEDVDARRDLARALLSRSTEDPTAGDEAIDLFRKVLAARPDDADARRGLEWQAQTDATESFRDWPDRRKLDRAVAIFRALAETAVAPDDGFAWAQYGNGARIGGDAATACLAFDKAVELNPFDGRMWNDRGIAFVAAGRPEEARASFEHAVSIDPGDTAPRQNLARLLRLSGKDDEADAHLAAALRTARAVGGPASLYRSLIDRGIRARRRPELR